MVQQRRQDDQQSHQENQQWHQQKAATRQQEYAVLTAALSPHTVPAIPAGSAHTSLSQDTDTVYNNNSRFLTLMSKSATGFTCVRCLQHMVTQPLPFHPTEQLPRTIKALDVRRVFNSAEELHTKLKTLL
ncbi:hypothetical protein Pcinc_020913 [Petrolisthes cinctipes]|uniref:Uncharacterized protein n=1 Tax=Petrolisthes cinctipes TaxID=88211 RepID=A0AAE1FJB4_PETCI|nr:hypothetical protein Pcinc_020913 [Petrolisthes cinctipes]